MLSVSALMCAITLPSETLALMARQGVHAPYQTPYHWAGAYGLALVLVLLLGFLPGKTLHTLSAGNVRRDFAAHLCAEQVDQRSLSHAGLAGNESHLPIALRGLPQQALQTF